jgi:hypothetical protein
MTIEELDAKYGQPTSSPQGESASIFDNVPATPEGPSRLSKIIDTYKKGATPGEMNPLRSGGRIAGELAGGVNDIIGGAVGGLAKGVDWATSGYAGKAISSVGEKIANTKTGQKTGEVIGDVMTKYQDWAKLHPEAEKDLSAFTNIASLLPIGFGTKKTVQTVAKTSPVKKYISEKAKTSLIKDRERIVQMVAPVLSKQEGESLVKSSTSRAPGVFKTARLDFSKDVLTQKTADAVMNLNLPKEIGFTGNFNRIKNHIAKISSRVIEPHLKQNPVPFNFDDLRTYMTREMKPPTVLNGNISPIIYKDTNEKLLGVLSSSLKSNIKKTGNVGNITNFDEIWKANINIDDMAEQQLKNFDFGTAEFAGAKRSIQDFRKSLRNFMTDSLSTPGQVDKINKVKQFLSDARAHGWEDPLGNNPKKAYDLLEKQFGINRADEDIIRAAVFNDAMEQLSYLYNATDNMAPKVFEEAGKNKIRILADKYPQTVRTVGYGLGGAGVASIASGLMGK